MTRVKATICAHLQADLVFIDDFHMSCMILICAWRVAIIPWVAGFVKVSKALLTKGNGLDFH